MQSIQQIIQFPQIDLMGRGLPRDYPTARELKKVFELLKRKDALLVARLSMIPKNGHFLL